MCCCSLGGPNSLSRRCRWPGGSTTGGLPSDLVIVLRQYAVMRPSSAGNTGRDLGVQPAARTSPYHLGAQGPMKVIDAGQRLLSVRWGRCSLARLLHFRAAHGLWGGWIGSPCRSADSCITPGSVSGSARQLDVTADRVVLLVDPDQSACSSQAACDLGALRGTRTP